MADDGTDPPSAPDDVLEGMEVLSLRVDFDLVADWSPVLEGIARYHGARTRLGVLDRAFVIKVALPPERKAAFLAEVQRYWDQFVERRKREGRWNR